MKFVKARQPSRPTKCNHKRPSKNESLGTSYQVFVSKPVCCDLWLLLLLLFCFVFSLPFLLFKIVIFSLQTETRSIFLPISFAFVPHSLCTVVCFELPMRSMSPRWRQNLARKILLFQSKKVNVLILKQALFDMMAQIRETIEALCTVLNNCCPEKVSAESFRQAKFDKAEATVTLWQTLHAVLRTESLKPVGKSDHDVVNFCKHKMFHKGYRVNDFFRLPEDMSRGSRELMLALGWLMAKEDVVTKFTNKLEPLIFEDPPMDLSLYDKIPLPAALGDFTEPSKQKDSKNSIDVAECLILNYNKLYSSLKSLLASKNEYTKIVCKLHTIPKTSKSQSSSHFSSQDVYFLRHPQKLVKYQEKLEWFCQYTKALVFWSLNELTFWKWMESVLDAKVLNDSKTEDEIENANGDQQNELFKPSRALQKAKEHQVELSQVLNAQEPVYRKVSKRWKKIKANLQQSGEERNENLTELLSSLDRELL